ncbi:MAG: hypothetical protein AAGJ35_13370, partial [Myxococcota bacterium]
FGTTMMSLGLLFWWPLLIQFVITWFRQRPLSWKVMRMTWLSAATSTLLLTVYVLHLWYKAKTQVQFGLYFSLVASILLTVGTHQVERQIIHKERILGLLS